MNITNIPAPRTEFIDPKTGLISREWYRFFVNLYTLVGSGTSDATIEDVQLLNIQLDQLSEIQKVSQSTELLSLIARYDVLVSAIDELRLMQPAGCNEAVEAIYTPFRDPYLDSLEARINALELAMQPQPVADLSSIALDNVRITNSTGGFSSLQSADYLASDASPGISTTVTTASLVGKTVSFKNGLITAFA